MESYKALEFGFVPAETYMCILDSDNKMIGIVNIRKQLNGAFLSSGGHINCSVLQTERYKGYATAIINFALKRCFNIGIDKAFVVCREDKIVFEMVILKMVVFTKNN